MTSVRPSGEPGMFCPFPEPKTCEPRHLEGLFLTFWVRDFRPPEYTRRENRRSLGVGCQKAVAYAPGANPNRILNWVRDFLACPRGPPPLYLTLGSGAWRSLVAHLLWEQRVAGSNPVAPTTFAGVVQR